MENIAQELISAGPGAAPVARTGDVVSGLMGLITKVPMTSAAAPLYPPRDVVTLQPIVEPREHIQPSPVYDRPKVVHLPSRVSPADGHPLDSQAMTPACDLPPTPGQPTSPAKSQTAMSPQLHAAPTPSPQRTNAILDLFV